MDDPEYSYFAPDRLVGVLGIGDPDDLALSTHLYELIHLTSRFGAFIRKGDKWDPLWPGWNPNPDLKYINFKADCYDKVVRAFDQSPEDYLYYEEFSEYQEILEWEGEFDNTVAPECLRDIDELVNWIQDFAEPKPAVITYGRHRVSCGDMAWMHPHVEDLQALRAETEEYVLKQRRKSAAEVLDEQLYQIQMYPPLHDQVVDAYFAAANAANDEYSLDEFDEDMNRTAFMKYYKGGTASMRELNGFHLELLAEIIDRTGPLSQKEVDGKVLVRAANLKPSDRLEAWFLHGQQTELYQIMANTRIGLFARYGKRKWQPVIRSREEEDVYDLNGVTIVQLRPEREVQIFAEFDAGNLHEMNINDPVLNKFKLDYRDDNPSGFDFYDRVNFNDKSTHLYSTLPSVASGVVMDMVVDLRTRINILNREEFDVDSLNGHLERLNAFLKDENEMSYYELHKILVEIS